MSTINNQTKGLFAIDTVEDLSHESAAAIQGGIKVWEARDFKGRFRNLPASSDLTRQRFNDKIASIHNNTRNTWEFFTNPNFTGNSFRLKPGERYGQLGRFYERQISSMRPV